MRLAFGALLRHCGLQDSAQAVGARLVDQFRRRIGFDGRERARPIAARGAIVEDRLRGPWQGAMLMRLDGMGERRLVVAAPARLHMEAAQPQRMGVAAVEHVPEGGFGARAIAGELRRLRAEQARQRLRADQPVRFGGMSARGAGIARADRHHAARQGREPLLTPARATGKRDERGSAQHKKEDAPKRDRQHRHPGDHDRQIRLDPIAEERECNSVAWVLGDPRQAQRDEAQQGEKEQQANHFVSASGQRAAGQLFTCRSPRAAPSRRRRGPAQPWRRQASHWLRRPKPSRRRAPPRAGAPRRRAPRRRRRVRALR